MSGLFGFFLRDPRPPAWMRARINQMHRLMVRRPDHGHHLEIHDHAAFGICGREAPQGSLLPYRQADGSVMLAEGEIYGGAGWPDVQARWAAQGAAGLRDADGLYSLVRYDAEAPN